MMMMLDNRNVYISILKINGESIITLLNKLPYLFNSRHPTKRYVHVVIKSLKIDNIMQTS